MQPVPETGRRLALLAATSMYHDPDLRQQPYVPGHDADELAEVLGDPRIGRFEVQVLINPTAGEIREGIEDFCVSQHPNDQLLMYLSCHGVLDSHGRLYYAAADTRLQRLASTAVAAEWLNDRLDECRARGQILVLDCSYAGAFAQGERGDAKVDTGHVTPRRPFGPGGVRAVLTATRSYKSLEGGQASGESVPSTFTRAIVNGLRTGDADLDGDGLITVSDLYRYVCDSVKASDPGQTPELWTQGARSAENNLLVAYSVHQEMKASQERARRGTGEQARRLAGSHPAVGAEPAARPKQETGDQIKREAVVVASAVEAQAERETQVQAPQPHPPKIFLCYRREDTQGFARGVYQILASKYGPEQVFRDIDSTPAGVRFSAWIESRVGQCSVMLVLIGGAWSSAKTGTGERRLDSSKDWVRQEIEAALKRDIPIIPVRVQGAPLPSEDELPPSIADLTSFQSAEITDSRWDYDLGILIEAIDDLITSD